MSRIVRLSQLVLDHPLWHNARTVTGLSDQELDELGDDILDRGQQIDLVVQSVYIPFEGDSADGQERQVVLLTLDGQRRVTALRRRCKARKKGQDTVQISVRDHVSEEPMELTPLLARRWTLDMVAAAVQRKGLSSYEQVEVAWGLRQSNPEDSLAEIAKAIGRSESWLSRMLRARGDALPSLLESWAKGKVTDEQFKDLSGAGSKQEEVLDKVLDLKAKGDRESASEARNLAKEVLEQVKDEKRKDKEKPAPRASAPASRKETPPVKEIWSFGQQKRPKDAYVKGLMHGVGLGLGEVSQDDLGSPWRTYVKQLQKAGIIQIPDPPKKSSKKRGTTANKKVER